MSNRTLQPKQRLAKLVYGYKRTPAPAAQWTEANQQREREFRESMRRHRLI